MTFYNLVNSLKTTEKALQSSGWMLLSSADTLFLHAKFRVFGSESTKKEKKENDSARSLSKDCKGKKNFFITFLCDLGSYKFGHYNLDIKVNFHSISYIRIMLITHHVQDHTSLYDELSHRSQYHNIVNSLMLSLSKMYYRECNVCTLTCHHTELWQFLQFVTVISSAQCRTSHVLEIVLT